MTNRLRQTAVAQGDSLAWAIRRMSGVLERVSRGTVPAAQAQRQLEAIAPALPDFMFDMAIDALADAADRSGQALRPVDWHDARVRKPADGLDAATRKARRRQAQTHGQTVGKGTMMTARIEANDASRVTAATRWRGEVGRTEDLCGPVVALRPVWAVDSAGVVADAADVFATPADVVHHAAAVGYGREVRVIDSAEPQIEDRSQWGNVTRQIGPSSPWRVLSIPADSPLVLAAAQVRAAAHDARLRAAERAAAYQRNGWVHGGAGDSHLSDRAAQAVDEAMGHIATARVVAAAQAAAAQAVAAAQIAAQAAAQAMA